MILLLGGTGYIGQAFATELRRRGMDFRSVSRSAHDYTRFDVLVELLRSTSATFLINCAGFTGKPNVDACETAQADTLLGNTILPQTIAHACEVAGVPWGHVSSGCIFSGAKVIESGQAMVMRDMTNPEFQSALAHDRAAIRGFTESDTPNFTFRQPPCSFYSGSKALGEEVLAAARDCYVWRLRIPFDEFDSPRNYLTKLQRYAKVYENVNSLSHRADFASACLNLWEIRAPFGTYNVTNPGFVTSHEVVAMIQRILNPAKAFEYWKDDTEFYQQAARTPRSNCIMDVSKLLAAGIPMRPVQQALEESLKNWKHQ
jgi:dTDP-4-dehydrorhamnose reductase